MTPDEKAIRRHIANLRSMVARIERDGYGRNYASTELGLRYHLRRLAELEAGMTDRQRQSYATLRDRAESV